MQDWFRDWFSSDDYLLVYNHRDNEDAVKLNRLILAETVLAENSKILDAACGAGRHSILFAKTGHIVTGFDLSENLLHKARQKAAKENVNVDFVCADIRYASFTGQFDLIANLFTSFGYFENDDENFAFIKNAGSFLKNNGWYVFDYFNATFLKNNLAPYSSRQTEDASIEEFRSFERNRVVKKIVIHRKGKEKIFFESVKLYTFEEIKRYFEYCGFRIEKLFGNYDGGEFIEDKSPRLIVFFKR